MDMPLGRTTTLEVGLEGRDVQGVEGGEDIADAGAVEKNIFYSYREISIMSNTNEAHTITSMLCLYIAGLLKVLVCLILTELQTLGPIEIPKVHKKSTC